MYAFWVVCVCVCHIHEDAQGDKKRASGALELYFAGGMNMYAGDEAQFSGRAASVL